MQSHANNDQLLKFRDKALLDACVKQHIEVCSICLAEVSELEVLSASLKNLDLPQLTSQELDKSWEIIESSFNRKRKIPTKFYWFASVASVVLALFLVVVQNSKTEIPEQLLVEQGPENVSNNDVLFTNSDREGEVQLNQLLAYSRLLESRLQAMPQPRVVRASTAGTITQLEDQISMLDTRLSMQTQAPLSTQQRNVLWQQRVNSMNNLYRVRAAQLQRVSY